MNHCNSKKRGLQGTEDKLSKMMRTFPRVGIVGTAGRGNKIKRLNPVIYQEMIRLARTTLEPMIDKHKTVVLVSGGAAWSDHVAVQLFLDAPEMYELVLHLPCQLDWKLRQFYDNGMAPKLNPGRTANYYHKQFSQKLERDTLADIFSAIDLGATVHLYHGFFRRNTEIAKTSDVLIAFSFARGDRPSDGGTLDTWKKSDASRKLHFSLDKMIC